jgi:predicted chitinase
LQSKLRLCHFLAQIAHESGGFTVKEESLNYKASKRLMQVWPKRFPTVASTKPFLGQPTKLGDKVYGGRMGNKDPGDGFKYRGRGYLQTTGRDAYKKFGDLINEDLENNPSLVAEPEISLRCAVAEWTESKVNKPADADDLRTVTKWSMAASSASPSASSGSPRPKGCLTLSEWKSDLRRRTLPRSSIARREPPYCDHALSWTENFWLARRAARRHG